jgi:hypothetical protein
MMNKFKVDYILSSEIYSFRKNCFFCTREITMSNKEGEWHPYEITGDPHKCPRHRKNPDVDRDQIKLDVGEVKS